MGQTEFDVANIEKEGEEPLFNDKDFLNEPCVYEQESLHGSLLKSHFCQAEMLEEDANSKALEHTIFGRIDQPKQGKRKVWIRNLNHPMTHLC